MHSDVVKSHENAHCRGQWAQHLDPLHSSSNKDGVQSLDSQLRNIFKDTEANRDRVTVNGCPFFKLFVLLKMLLGVLLGDSSFNLFLHVKILLVLFFVGSCGDEHLVLLVSDQEREPLPIVAMVTLLVNP